MDFDRYHIERTVYSFSDWLGVVGGFMGSVEFIFVLLVPLTNVQSLEKYMVKTLFHRYIEADDQNINYDEIKKLPYNERKLA